jgi:hypothetical protein
MQDLKPKTLTAGGALLVAMMAALLLAPIPGCDDDGDAGLSGDTCRFEPEHCNGGYGGLCDHDEDCASGLYCCDDNDNCGDGMCTAECDNDHDCPSNMLCEHHMCFYTCDSDEDCAPTMSCEHQNTICEYD